VGDVLRDKTSLMERFSACSSRYIDANVSELLVQVYDRWWA
jgi:hypothetical protein